MIEKHQKYVTDCRIQYIHAIIYTGNFGATNKQAPYSDWFWLWDLCKTAEKSEGGGRRRGRERKENVWNLIAAAWYNSLLSFLLVKSISPGNVKKNPKDSGILVMSPITSLRHLLVPTFTHNWLHSFTPLDKRSTKIISNVNMEIQVLLGTKQWRHWYNQLVS